MKKLIVDFDDTLSFTNNRNWQHAKPNTKLINKLNKLQKDGWIVNIYTARGSLSCDSRKSAETKYKKQIEKWCKLHCLNYNSLSFEKPLAAYYIDDKAIKPEDFLALEIEQLNGGLSGSDIYTDGKLVYKEDSKSVETLQWFGQAKNNSIKIPKINSIIGNTISMEYIKHNEKYALQNEYQALGQILEITSKFKEIKTNNQLTIKHYFDRIKQHVENSNNKLLSTYYMLYKNNYPESVNEPSFAHGDFGIMNLLFSDVGLYLIDPIQSTFTHWKIDIAKFMASLLFNNSLNDYSKLYNFYFNYLLVATDLTEIEFKTMILFECIRIFKYYPDKQYFLRILGEYFNAA